MEISLFLTRKNDCINKLSSLQCVEKLSCASDNQTIR